MTPREEGYWFRSGEREGQSIDLPSPIHRVRYVKFKKQRTVEEK